MGETKIYPNPMKVEFQMRGFTAGDTMFKNCTLRFQNNPTSTVNIDVSFDSLRKEAGYILFSFSIGANALLEGMDPKLIDMDLHSFPIKKIELTSENKMFSISTEMTSDNKIIESQLNDGMLSLSKISQYEPLTRRLPGNIKTCGIHIFIPRAEYGSASYEMKLFPVDGVIVNM